MKLATELSKRATGKTLYLLDEPTTGLSFSDCAALLKVLHRLVDTGNTVLLIEHNLDVIKNSDWIVDLGPGAGDSGGYVIATGTPEDIASNPDSFTGIYLGKGLAAGRANAAVQRRTRGGRRLTRRSPAAQLCYNDHWLPVKEWRKACRFTTTAKYI